MNTIGRYPKFQGPQSTTTLEAFTEPQERPEVYLPVQVGTLGSSSELSKNTNIMSSQKQDPVQAKEGTGAVSCTMCGKDCDSHQELMFHYLHAHVSDETISAIMEEKEADLIQQSETGIETQPSTSTSASMTPKNPVEKEESEVPTTSFNDDVEVGIQSDDRSVNQGGARDLMSITKTESGNGDEVGYVSQPPFIT